MANEHVSVNCSVIDPATGKAEVTYRDDTQAEKDERVVAQAARVVEQKAEANKETARLALVESGDVKLRTAGLTQPEIDARRNHK